MIVISIHSLILLLGKAVASTILTETPKSRNVSTDKVVEFTCASSGNGELTDLIWLTDPVVSSSSHDETILPSGERHISLRFNATTQHNSTIITCVARKDISVLSQSRALLLVQGKDV